MIMKGMAACASITIKIACSTLPRMKAARNPSATPIAAETSVATKAMLRLIRIEAISRESTSRPSSSVPSG